MENRTLKDWIIASRPWSFTASLIPVIAISSYLFYQSRIFSWECNWVNALLALPMLICLQAAGNLIGDYYDHIRNVDLPGSLNQVRHIQSGKFTPKEILHYGYWMLAVAAVLGLVILSRSSWSAIWLGALGLAMVYFYPWLKYHALGDLDVLFGYALLPALGVSFVVTGVYHWEVLLLSLPFGVLTVAILHANNTRDILNDKRAGIKTMPMALGARASQWLYAVELVMAYVLVLVLFLVGLLPAPAFATYITIPMAVSRIKTMLTAEPLAEEPIGGLDQATAQMQMAFGIIFTLSFLVATFI
ncbi:MAG: prenyltransferase [Bacteroidales bacterium]|nr:prenyltransferase [Bacteroidales bacterium]